MDTTTRNALISRQIMNLIQAGVDPVEAAKRVCGHEAIERMIDEIYAVLRAKAVR